MKKTIVNLNKTKTSIIYLLAEDYPFTCKTNMVLINSFDWNRQLSPWPNPAIFKKGENFKGEADIFIPELISEIEQFEKQQQLQITRRALVGYSLAGLFAFYCLYKTAFFNDIAAVSASFWYPGFTDYVTNNKILADNPFVYLSLGKQEENSKNPHLQTVGKKTQLICNHLQKNRYHYCYIENPGGHFTDPPGRLNQAIKTLTDNYT